jgi:hypothetical protein
MAPMNGPKRIGRQRHHSATRNDCDGVAHCSFVLDRVSSVRRLQSVDRPSIQSRTQTPAIKEKTFRLSKFRKHADRRMDAL